MTAIKDYELEECRFIRTEILQYLEEYQTVRNMMYAVTGTLLGFGIGTSKPYLLLLPLLVIIPSYFISIDYEKCVHVAATYLKVFYESRKDFPIKWETRKVYLEGCCLLQVSDKYVTSFNRQQLPYKISALACVTIYLGLWVLNNIALQIDLVSRKINFESVTGGFDLLLGIFAMAAVFTTVFKFKSISYNTCWRAWEEIYQKEHNVGIPTDAKTAISEFEHYALKVGTINKIKWILSGKRPKGINDCGFSDFQNKSYRTDSLD